MNEQPLFDKLMEAREAAESWAKHCRAKEIELKRALAEVGVRGERIEELETTVARYKRHKEEQDYRIRVLEAELEAERAGNVPVDPPEPEPTPVPPFDQPGAPVLMPGPFGAVHRGSESFGYGALPRNLAAMLDPVPQYEIPTRAECHWIVGDDGARSNDGAQVFVPRDSASGDVIGTVYRKHVERGGPLPCRIGIDTANAGRAIAGGQWNAQAPHSIVGGGPVQVELVGLRSDAEVSASWSNAYAYVEHLGLYNLFLRGAKDSFAIRAMQRAGRIFIDGCTILEHPEIAAKRRASGRTADYTSGLHCKNYESLVVANMDQRRTKGDEEPVKFIEHVLYPKGSRGGGLFVLHNYFIGGNRTGCQQRPDGPDDQSFPESALGHRGDIVFMGNLSEGWGWDHEGSNGGQWLTAWQCPFGDVAFLNNRLVNGRYGGLGAAAQQDYRNVYNTQGRPLNRVHLWGNDIDTARSPRPSIAVTGANEVHLWGGNKISPGSRPMEVDTQWGHEKHGIKSGSLSIHAPDDIPVFTYSPQARKVVPVTPPEVAVRGSAWSQSPDGQEKAAKAVAG